MGVDYLSNYRYNTGDPEAAVQAATRALAIASELGDFALTISATLHLGCAHYYRGEYREAAEILQRNLKSLEQRPSAERLAWPCRRLFSPEAGWPYRSPSWVSSRTAYDVPRRRSGSPGKPPGTLI